MTEFKLRKVELSDLERYKELTDVEGWNLGMGKKYIFKAVRGPFFRIRIDDFLKICSKWLLKPRQQHTVWSIYQLEN